MMQRRWPILLAVVLIAIGLSRLRFDVDVLNLLPQNLPVVQGLRWQQEHFANARELIITIKADSAEAAEEGARSLAGDLRQQTNLVSRAIWQPPWQEDALGAAELVAYLWLNSEPQQVQMLEKRLSAEDLPKHLTAVREQLATSFSPESIARSSYDPLDLLNVSSSGLSSSSLGSNRLFASEDGTFHLMHVDPAKTLKNYHEAIEWLAQVRGVIAQWQKNNPDHAGLKVKLTGGPAFMSEIAGSMEGEMRGSMSGSLLLIALVFLLAHRKLKPLMCIIVLMLLTVIVTMAASGFLFGRLNVVSLGFAAILFGMVVDYALVMYQEGLSEVGKSPAEIRAMVAPGIWWSSLSTAAAFAALSLCGLPGLAQLGVLVAVGIIAGAIIVLHFFPRVLPTLKEQQADAAKHIFPSGPSKFPGIGLWLGSTLVLAAVVMIVTSGLPGLTASSQPLRPRHSEAYDAMDQLKVELGRTREPVMIVVSGKSDEEVSKQLAQAQAKLDRHMTNGLIGDALLPTSLWPNPERIKANLPILQRMTQDAPRIREALLTAGFTVDSFKVADVMFRYWTNQNAELKLPQGPTAKWVMEQVLVRKDQERFALGIITPTAKGEDQTDVWSSDLENEGTHVAGWELLGIAILRHVQQEFFWVFVPSFVLLMITLWCAFRRWSEVIVSMGVLAISGIMLLAVMQLLGWKWNLLNLMAIPLLLGSCEDYSIHLQLTLRRTKGDWRHAWHSTGKAVLLCAASTIIGFGSLMFSENAGLASLGQVCAAGVACAIIVSLLLIPGVWVVVAGPLKEESVSKPSKFYGAKLWQIGMWLGKSLPAPVTGAIGRLLARGYALVKPDRHDVVVKNLLPLVKQDNARAQIAANQLFSNFGQKLADLWRYESGADVANLFGEWNGWEYFDQAQRKGKGVLLVTPHLGNWEFGGPLLTKRGVKLLVLTLAEPGAGFTELRQKSRERWGIETLVVQQDAFAFVEVIKRLQEGACVALLIDRPPAGTGVDVTLCGQLFSASISAAELARATGCAILPTAIVRSGDTYSAHILPEMAYERAALGSREAREKFTGEIMRAFEPLLTQYPDQWYHFVSIWPPARG
jgi:predicted RND superfamily exporter protein/lauroyl/myristoyl acyltransferase